MTLVSNFQNVPESVECMKGTIENEPFYHQGICHVGNPALLLSIPCQNRIGEYNCSEELPHYYFCRGFSVSLETENCEE